MLLFARFKVTNKLERIDFTNDDDWFDHKFIDNFMYYKDFKHIKDRMGSWFHEDKIKQLEKALDIKLPSVLHLGHRIAICIIEILQILLKFIKELGM